MAFSAGYKARVLLGDFSLSAKLTDTSVPLSVDMHDVTTYADDGVKVFIPGQRGSTFSLSGFTDAATNTDQAAWTAAQPFTYGPMGLANGSHVWMLDALQASYEPGTQVGSAASFSVSGQTTGVPSLGVSLLDLAAITGTTNSTSIDGGASSSAGCVGHLHVTAYSGWTDVSVAIQDSADDAAWSTIGSFATVTGVTGERLAIAGTVRRYVRARVTGTGAGSVTLAVAFSRN